MERKYTIANLRLRFVLLAINIFSSVSKTFTQCPVTVNTCGVVRDSTQVLVICTHADFSADNACFGDSTQFTDLSYSYSDATYTIDPNFPVTSWLRDFGDNTSSTLENPPPHTYQENDTYQISLTLKETKGTP